MALFLESREIPELPVRRGPSLVWVEAGSPVILCQLLNVDIQLFDFGRVRSCTSRPQKSVPSDAVVFSKASGHSPGE